ncbi:hypothetical protein S130_09525 [Salmonella enterica subsp. enterica serovar Tennessee]|nr:hypothetical protein SEET0819_07175 [Salmonella enterica subsp. enterica serovar Tennessee str. TXSC_TXSC08-19]KWQ17011.1 hypothetical protein Y596_02460 [Salmonella enterica subsp. enterica serovar Tennessee]KWQ59311.1 hypothetical protein SEET2691_01000 [Salmonella enterica subsp. enterica serovar Tennessee str. 2691]KWQ18675.1 hypothetical protein Y101_06250 [Salmonella enterica subsp. enterica serovar Tennessee]KWQ21371.1 hypothetical protein AH92_18235 [Salmonella enterica subsp. enteri
MVVDSGGNHRLEAGKVVRGGNGARCGRGDGFREEASNHGGHAADGKDEQEQKAQYEPHP